MFGDYFQWNTCTHFQKIDSKREYERLKKKQKNFRKELLTFEVFCLWKMFACYFQWKAYVHLWKKCDWTRYKPGKMIKRKHKFLWLYWLYFSISSFCKSCALNSRKYVAKQGIRVLNWSGVLNSFMTEAVIIYKPVHWFARQINGLVSVW